MKVMRLRNCITVLIRNVLGIFFKVHYPVNKRLRHPFLPFNQNYQNYQTFMIFHLYKYFYHQNSHDSPVHLWVHRFLSSDFFFLSREPTLSSQDFPSRPVPVRDRDRCLDSPFRVVQRFAPALKSPENQNQNFFCRLFKL